MLMAGSAMAAAERGSDACTPEDGDLRTTRWTSEKQQFGIVWNFAASAIKHNSVNLSVDLQQYTAYYTPPFPDDPKLLHIAVMGNDATAGTNVHGGGRIVDDLDALTNVTTVNKTIRGLKPNAHYVAVVYSPLSRLWQSQAVFHALLPNCARSRQSVGRFCKWLLSALCRRLCGLHSGADGLQCPGWRKVGQRPPPVYRGQQLTGHSHTSKRAAKTVRSRGSPPDPFAAAAGREDFGICKNLPRVRVGKI